jgi:hypothetical protein
MNFRYVTIAKSDIEFTHCSNVCNIYLIFFYAKCIDMFMNRLHIKFNILSRVKWLWTDTGLTAAFIGLQYTLYSSLQCTLLSSLGRVYSRLGPGPPADPTVNYQLCTLISTTHFLSHIKTDDQSGSASWFRAPSGGHDEMLITVWQLLFCRYRAPPLTRGRVCHLS